MMIKRGSLVTKSDYLKDAIASAAVVILCLLLLFSGYDTYFKPVFSIILLVVNGAGLILNLIALRLPH